MSDPSKDVTTLRKEKLKAFLKNNDHLLIIVILLIAAVFKLYFFFSLGNQPIWWDEGDYLSLAKFWSFKVPLTDSMSYLLGMRPFLLSLIGALFFKLGLGESFLRFFAELVPSIASVLVIYLIGKEVYGKWAGIASSLMLSFYWVWSFYSFRVMTDVPSTFLALLSIYYFVVYYEKKGLAKGLYLSILFGVLAFYTRFPQAVVLLTIAAYLLITRKFSLFKDKVILKSVGLLLLLLLPYFIYLASTGFSALKIYFGGSSTTVTNPAAFGAITSVFSFMHLSWAILGLIGLVSLIPLFLGLDLVWKQKDKSLNSDLLFFMILIAQLFFYVFIIRSFDDRWLLVASMALFIIAGKGFVSLESFLRPYIKNFAIIACFMILLFGVYQNIGHAGEIIRARETSYAAVRDAGLWLKQNSAASDSVVTSSIVQNYYYSQRVTHDMKPTKFPDECVDSSQVGTSQCQNKWENAFNEEVLFLKPSYFIISQYEPGFTPQWAYTYAARNNLSAVWVDNTAQPTLIVYKYPENFVPNNS
ncbi:MAG: glycosyltransferase family 39 protein [Nanoarchaeota archaeon]